MWPSRASEASNRAYQASLEGDKAWHERHLALYHAHDAAHKAAPIGENPEEDPDVLRTLNELEAHFGGPMLPPGRHGSPVAEGKEQTR